MAFDPTPWFVGGGANHSPEVARAFTYAATRGSEGVTDVGDLKVVAQAVPNSTVQVIPGGGLLRNRYAGGGGQTYAIRGATATDVPITSTGSAGGRTDLIVARVVDPQYEGLPPADPNNFEYARPAVIEGVSAGATVKSLGLSYPAINLARVTLPANTATVTAAMITDLRRVAQPRRERNLMTMFPTASNNMPTSYGPTWPIAVAQRPSLYVPSWATKLNVVVNMSGIRYTKGATAADTVAGIKTALGTAGNWNYSENGILVQDAEDTGGRYHYSLIGQHVIPAAMRDSYQLLDLLAMRSAGSGTWTADNQTSVSIDVEFEETAA
ncbi:hypothetical protein [Arthrobacter woluwensis]|uniref:hypothetical protein n=1 Tax=Arthrobacter woluwensis TaxID=156980 RepID=UPI0038227EE2